jgi:hypothetical protein
MLDQKRSSHGKSQAVTCLQTRRPDLPLLDTDRPHSTIEST